MRPLFGAPGGWADHSLNQFRGQNLEPNFDQASAVRQWWNCAADRASPGELLRINLDETSVCLFQGGGKGTVICRKRRLGGELVQRATTAKKRTYLTHIALARDRPDLQPLFLQILIGNEATFHAADLSALQAACPRRRARGGLRARRVYQMSDECECNADCCARNAND